MKFSTVTLIFLFLFLLIKPFPFICFKYSLIYVLFIGNFVFSGLRETIISEYINKGLLFGSLWSFHERWLCCLSMDHCRTVFLNFWNAINFYFSYFWHMWWKCFVQLGYRYSNRILFCIERFFEFNISIHLLLECFFPNLVYFSRWHDFSCFFE